MAEETGIEWCDSTFNPWIGCTKVSEGCNGCYAEVSTPARTQKIMWGPGQARHRTAPANWAKPMAWERGHLSFELKHGRRRRVFCASLADVFDNEVDPAWRADLFKLISETPNLDWLLLTKRIGNAERMIDEAMNTLHHRKWGDKMPGDPACNWPDDGWDNVWLGATVVNQEEADRDIPKLLAVPARVRFLSIEPLLGPVDLTNIQTRVGTGTDVFSALEYDGDPDDDVEFGTATLDWVVVGGESGAQARPMHPDWVRSLRDQCASASVPFLFKQWGEWCTSQQMTDQTGDSLYTDDLSQYRVDHQAMDNTGATSFDAEKLSGGARTPVYRIGKASAGRLLDGQLHNGYPKDQP